jgi:hypothetical protein
MNIKRNLDVIYRNADLEHLYTFSKFPVFMGCTAADSCDDLREDMSFWVSRQSGMIQLNPLLPLDINYPEAHGAGLVGKLWAQHHQAFAEYIGKFSPSSVLEIGGAHGILANNYQSIKSIPWIIVEPNPTPVKDCKAKIIKGFFDEKFKISEDVDAVIHSHVFEHIYDPMKFMSHLREFMGTGKKLIFSVPNMRVMMSRKYTNCLNFEHTIFLTEEYIEYLLSSNGFRILEHCYFLDDHSIFFAAVREENVKVVMIPEFLYEKNKSMYLAYISEHQQLINSINKEISGLSNVFLFGAHAQAQYLIGFGLNIKDIDAILDNDKNKHGKRLYGTNKIVLDPAMLGEIKTPTVIVRAGTFTSEIVEQILSINPNTNILL